MRYYQGVSNVKRKNKKSNKKSNKSNKKSTSVQKGMQKFTKKYRNRPSPPYPANEMCGKTKLGNDGNHYLSKANKNGICSWKKI